MFGQKMRMHMFGHKMRMPRSLLVVLGGKCDCTGLGSGMGGALHDLVHDLCFFGEQKRSDGFLKKNGSLSCERKKTPEAAWAWSDGLLREKGSLFGENKNAGGSLGPE